jgi:hypothetical protein
MTAPQRRADAQSRLRKAHATLVASRALLLLEPPLRDDAVNRASSAALQAARALVDSQWARDSQPDWDPTWRPGMPRPGEPKDPLSADAVGKLLDRFHVLASGMGLAPDFTDYVRTLVEDGFDADVGELPEYDEEEARMAISTAETLLYMVAARIGLVDELRAKPAPSLRLPSAPAGANPPEQPPGAVLSSETP